VQKRQTEEFIFMLNEGKGEKFSQLYI